ncbi:MAG: heme-degrading domain-containing protein [Thiofilum sp.]|uniref:heme-degrading domain-containing protein n=1 Tax=Thiofilum sp. TaxID=2212733 RepID=UPI0025ED4269|nr:heme-degrading domain-containing protein [Thiofilum sp.]MBK8455270.1 heme-degrading domain-containing protein [Thiofilum sp.]
MDYSADLERIALQEQRLRFTQFNADIAWDLGNRLRQKALERQQALVIDITINGFQLFCCAMAGTTPENTDWARRKRNVVNRFQRSSYAMGLHLAHKQVDLMDKYGLATSDYAAHGGCFPIRVSDVMIGTVVVSGLPQREDHNLVVEVLCEMLNQPLETLRLDSLS